MAASAASPARPATVASTRRAGEQRDDAQHPAGHDDPGAPPQAGDPRVPGAFPQRAAQDGGDPGEQVWHADQVAQDEVAVEAGEREQLLQHLQVRDGDDQEQDLGQGDRVEAGQRQHEDQVEVGDHRGRCAAGRRG